MNQAKCDHCPLLAEDRVCPGQRNRGICRKTDQASPNYRPAIVAKVLGFVVAVSKHVAAGMPIVTPEVKKERLAICQACEWFNGDGCRKCGCSGLKLTWAEQSCPIGKWGPSDQRV